MRVICLWLCGAALLAQEPIRVTTRLVEVNVSVRDKSGPVRGLTRDDFTVFDRGKQRPIVAFSAHTLQTVVPPAPIALPPGTFTNRREISGGSPTTATIVLLDGINTLLRDQIWVKKQFTAFLSQARPTDRIAVYSLGRNLRVLNDYTSDAGRLLETLKQSSVEVGLSPDIPDDDMDMRVRLTVEAMEAIARQVGRLPGRKSLIWLSSSFPFMYRKKTYLPELARISRAMSDSDIAVYPVDARGLVGMPALSADLRGGLQHAGTFVPLGQDTMSILADATGGRAFLNDNHAHEAIRLALADSEVTYTLAFQPDVKVFDSTLHQIKVKVNRPGVNVRHRDGYLATPDTPAGETDRAIAIQGALRSPLDAGAIGLQVSIERSNGAMQLAITASDCAGGPLDVILAQRTADGRDMGTGAFLVESPCPANLHRAIALAPAAVEVKVVVYDRASGKMGSVAVPAR